MKKHHRHENDCLNCGTELQGHFCHVCGQENLHIKEPFWHFLSHSISHYFHFDEKFFSTLKPLLTQPGQLTLDYVAGKRTRFLQPVSMYIFISIIYFLVIPNLKHKETKDVVNIGPVNIHSSNDDDTETSPAADSILAAKKALKNVYMGSDKVNEKVQKALDKAAAKARAKDKNNGYSKFNKLPFAVQTHVIDSLKLLNKAHPSDTLQDRLDNYTQTHIEREDSTVASYDKRQLRLPVAERDDWIETFFKRKEIDFKQKTNKDWSFSKELEHYQPKLYFILMPLFAFFLMWNFRKNHKYYVEHIVFTIHIFSAFFIFQIVTKPIDHFIFGGSKLFGIVCACAVAWYIYTALRVFYQRPKWPTIRKMVTLSILYGLAFSISLAIISAVIYLNVYLGE